MPTTTTPAPAHTCAQHEHIDLASVVGRPIMAAPASATTATAPPLVVEVDRSVRIPDDDAVYTSKVVYERAQFALVLYRDRLAFFGADSKRGTRTLEHGGRGRLGCAR